MSDGAEREPLLSNSEEEHASQTPDADRLRAQRQQQLLRDQRIQFGRFTSLEKFLFALSIGLFILLCIFVGLYARRAYADGRHEGTVPVQPPSPTGTPGTHRPEPEVCLTPQCILTAAEILKDIDVTVDPCEDFFAYTCNNWIKAHDIPEGKSKISAFTVLETQNKETMHSIFKHDFDVYQDKVASYGELPSPDKLLDRQNFQKGKNLFDSCMNESLIDSRGAEPILPLLRNIRDIYSSSKFGADGLSDEHNTDNVGSSNGQLARTIAYLAKEAGVDAFFSIMVDADPKDSEVTSLQLYQSGLSLPSKEYYEQQDALDAFYEAVSETLDAVFRDTGNEFGWSRYSANTTARLVVDFERLLASISDRPEDLMDPEKAYNPLTLSQLRILSPSIDWGLLLNHLLPPTAPHQDTIVVTGPEYIAKVSSEVLEKSTQRTIEAYLMWQVIHDYAHALSEDIRKPLDKLDAKLRGTNMKVSRPRWEICVDQVNESLGFLAGRYFVLQKFNKNAKERADGFVDAIKNGFLEQFSELSWIDDTTRERAVEKVHHLVRKIGYPTTNPDIMSPVSISDYYSDLSMDKEDYFGNYLRSRRWTVMQAWRDVGKQPDRNKWLMAPQIANAYYNPAFNEIVFPAGIIQAPVFSEDYPDYLSFGGLGAVVGHELSHGFDAMGRHFDARGRLVEWWTNETARSFDEKAECFVREYDNYTMDGPNGEKLHLNGRFTLGENIADSGGVHESFLAWKSQYEHGHGNNKLLPGLDNFSPEQLFFINFGRIWCDNETPEQTKQAIFTDEHAPRRWRVNGSVRNSKIFADVFKCPVGSRMNPKEKCELW